MATRIDESQITENVLIIEKKPDQNLILHQIPDSSLFSVEVSINDLVAAAQPLLSIIQRLNLTSSIDKPLELKKQIENELEIFCSRADEANYGQDIIRVARYLLTIVLDEMFGKLRWHSISDYLCVGRFTPSSPDGPEAGERFFLILEKMFENPDDHLELMELAYLCMSFGYEGKYKEHTNKREQLDFLLDRLYVLIQKHRHDERRHLLISANNLREKAPGIKRISMTYVVLTMLIILSVSFIGFNALLGKQLMNNGPQLAHQQTKTEKVAHG